MIRFHLALPDRVPFVLVSTIFFLSLQVSLSLGQPAHDPGAIRAWLLHSNAAAVHTPPFAPSERWIAFDKAQHVAFSFLWTLGTQYTLVEKADISNRHALPFSMAGSAALGIAKELYDWRLGPRRVFSHRDLVADAVGILLAGGIILL